MLLGSITYTATPLSTNYKTVLQKKVDITGCHIIKNCCYKVIIKTLKLLNKYEITLDSLS